MYMYMYMYLYMSKYVYIQEFEEQGIENVEVWRKGIDTVSFNPKYKNAETRNMLTDGNPDDFLIVYIGRLGLQIFFSENIFF